MGREQGRKVKIFEIYLRSEEFFYSRLSKRLTTITLMGSNVVVENVARSLRKNLFILHNPGLYLQKDRRRFMSFPVKNVIKRA